MAFQKQIQLIEGSGCRRGEQTNIDVSTRRRRSAETI